MATNQNIIMMGATGAVGSMVVKRLLNERDNSLETLTLLGRRPLLMAVSNDKVLQHEIDILKPSTFVDFIPGHTTAICTLGVGEPSTMSKEQWLRIDKTAVLDFAHACKNNGVEHFQILTSVGANSSSKSFYLRVKGELEDALVALSFKRLSIFQPSMIITPNNRYGISQAITLAVWPSLSKVLIGGLKKYRGIDVDVLGKAIANNTFEAESGLTRYQWQDFERLANL